MGLCIRGQNYINLLGWITFSGSVCKRSAREDAIDNKHALMHGDDYLVCKKIMIVDFVITAAHNPMSTLG